MRHPSPFLNSPDTAHRGRPAGEQQAAASPDEDHRGVHLSQCLQGICGRIHVINSNNESHHGKDIDRARLKVVADGIITRYPAAAFEIDGRG